MKKISSFTLKILGWKTILSVPSVPKSIICIAPHTSNWDFFLGKLFCLSEGVKSGFLMKKFWFFFPFNIILRSMGGIPVDRSKKTSITQQVVNMFNSNEEFHLGITPEGTRKKVKKWKMGFYNIAKKANVPICLAYIDYGKKEVGITKIIYPTDDEKADLKEIFDFYKGATARHPSKFYLPKL